MNFRIGAEQSAKSTRGRDIAHFKGSSDEGFLMTGRGCPKNPQESPIRKRINTHPEGPVVNPMASVKCTFPVLPHPFQLCRDPNYSQRVTEGRRNNGKEATIVHCPLPTAGFPDTKRLSKETEGGTFYCPRMTLKAEGT